MTDKEYAKYLLDFLMNDSGADACSKCALSPDKCTNLGQKNYDTTICFYGLRVYIEQKVKAEKAKISFLTAKGIATVCAIDNNLLPKIEGGWDDTDFNKFWEDFEKRLTEAGYVIEVKK